MKVTMESDLISDSPDLLICTSTILIDWFFFLYTASSVLIISMFMFEVSPTLFHVVY